MIISQPKAADLQQRLFDPRRITTMGAARYWVGETAEELTAAYSGATRLRTDSRADVCPDLRLSARVYLEVKAVGCSNNAIIYDHRLRKDRAFCNAAGCRLYYWFWRHDKRVGDVMRAADSTAEFQAIMRAAFYEVLVVPLPALERLLWPRPIKVLNTNGVTADGRPLGYGSKGYGHGWAASVNDLRGVAGATIRIQRRLF